MTSLVLLLFAAVTLDRGLRTSAGATGVMPVMASAESGRGAA